MIRMFARAFAGVLVLLFGVASVQAQTMEIFAGGGRFANLPGTEIGLQVRDLVRGPDGYIYVLDPNKFVMRFDPVAGTITALPLTPAHPDGVNADFGYPDTMAFDSAGDLYVATSGRLYRFNVTSGERVDVGPLPDADQMAFAANGTLYFVTPEDSRIRARAPSGEISIVAGTGASGFSGDGGPALEAMLAYPRNLAIASNGDIYFADGNNYRVRRIDIVTGIISTVAGTGEWEFNAEGLPATQTNMAPNWVAFDPAGNLLIGDSYRLLRVDATSGLVSSIAGIGTYYGGGGDGGLATAALIVMPRSFVFDAAGNLYFAQTNDYPVPGHSVRKINPSTGIITRAIGNNTFYLCGDGQLPRAACLLGTNAVAERGGSVAIVETSRMRQVPANTGLMQTVDLGTGYNEPYGVAYDRNGNIYFTSWQSHKVFRIDAATGARTLVTGTGSRSTNGDGGPATAASVALPMDVAFDSDGNIYISEEWRIRRIDAVTGIITKYAGMYNGPASGDGGLATAAYMTPRHIEFDPAGNLVLVDGQNCRIRRISRATGIINTIAGNGNCNGITGDGVAATSTSIGSYPAMALDYAGNVFLGLNGTLYRVDAVTGIITRVSPYGGFTTPEGVRVSGSVAAMQFDSLGRLYLVQQYGRHVFRVTGLADSSPPVIQPQITGTLGNGWYRSNVQVGWIVTDAESAVTSQSGCTTSSVTEDTAGVTFTCSATSKGGTSAQSVTIRRDTVAPTLSFGLASPEANESGWHQADVTIPFVAEDALSGVFSTSSENPIVFTQEGANPGRQVTVTDQAGNSTTLTSPGANIDRSGPVIQHGISGALGNNGWYVGNIQVTWTVSEATSSITSSDGCAATAVINDTAGVTFTCTASSGGGTATDSVTVKRDATPPALEFGAPSPAPAITGWNNTTVSIPFTASDATSGVKSASAPSPLVFEADGEGLFQQVQVADNAGNVATFESPRVNIDRTPPTVQAQVVGTLGNNGWYRSDVHVSWSIGDAPISTTGCDASDLTTDTAGTTFSCTATSAGGTTSSSVTIKRDATPPVLGFGTPSPAPNTNGWNKTNVSIPFTRSDALSGLASTSVASPLVLSTEGPYVTGDVVVTDNAGNTATFTSVSRNIDKSAPEVWLNSPADGATYGFYQDVFADYGCTDVSLMTCTAPTPGGEYINTRTAGARTFKVTSKDTVGFITTVTNAFTVESTFNFGAFSAPSNEPPTLNLVSRGALVPIRWQLPDGHGGYVTNPASFSSATVGSLTCGSATVVPYGDTASGDAGIGYDAASNSFVYNWQTSSSWTGCRKLTIKLKDGSLHELRFKFQ